MEKKNFTYGEILSKDEIESRRSTGCGVVAVRAGEMFKIYSDGERCINNSYELDILKKNRSGAIVLHGKDKVVCIPEF